MNNLTLMCIPTSTCRRIIYRQAFSKEKATFLTDARVQNWWRRPLGNTVEPTLFIWCQKIYQLRSHVLYDSATHGPNLISNLDILDADHFTDISGTLSCIQISGSERKVSKQDERIFPSSVRSHSSQFFL